MAAVVVMSSTSVGTLQAPSLVITLGSAGVANATPAHPSLQVRALLARVNVGEAGDDANNSVLLHLAQIHGQRGVVLLRHLNPAARPLEGDLREGRQHLPAVGAPRLLYCGLVQVYARILQHREVVR